jgi:hypothetical protein
MISFMEYSHNLDQVVDSIHKMGTLANHARSDKASAPDTAHRNFDVLLGHVPVDMIDKLPEGVKSKLCNVLSEILEYHIEAWDKVGRHVQQLWDHPVNAPGKVLGKELLNRASAWVMRNIGAEFFIGYSGEMTKAVVHHYTGQVVRVFVSKSNYR